jgi:hypothetical protein
MADAQIADPIAAVLPEPYRVLSSFIRRNRGPQRRVYQTPVTGIMAVNRAVNQRTTSRYCRIVATYPPWRDRQPANRTAY